MADFQNSSLGEWKLHLAKMQRRPEILLCGAKPWPGSVQTNHRAHFPDANWMTTDIEAGEGVGIVADLQTMWQTCTLKFDGIFCPAVLEHIERPWTAMYSMSQLLAEGGALFVQTHQTFPLHGYPNDFYRFSTEALTSLCRDAGLRVLLADYDGPCTITPSSEQVVWNVLAPAFLNSNVCAVK